MQKKYQTPVEVDEYGMITSDCPQIGRLDLPSSAKTSLREAGFYSIKALQRGLLTGRVTRRKIPGLGTNSITRIRECLITLGAKISPTPAEKICCTALGLKFEHIGFLENPFSEHRVPELKHLLCQILYPRELEAIKLKFFEGRGTKWISEHFEVPLTTAYGILSSAQHKMRCRPVPTYLRELMMNRDLPKLELSQPSPRSRVKILGDNSPHLAL